MNQTKILNGKKYYLLTSPKGIERRYTFLVAKDQREMGHRARAIKIGDKYFVYTR